MSLCNEGTPSRPHARVSRLPVKFAEGRVGAKWSQASSSTRALPSVVTAVLQSCTAAALVTTQLMPRPASPIHPDIAVLLFHGTSKKKIQCGYFSIAYSDRAVCPSSRQRLVKDSSSLLEHRWPGISPGMTGTFRRPCWKHFKIEAPMHNNFRQAT